MTDAMIMKELDRLLNWRDRSGFVIKTKRCRAALYACLDRIGSGNQPAQEHSDPTRRSAAK